MCLATQLSNFFRVDLGDNEFFIRFTLNAPPILTVEPLPTRGNSREH